MSYGSRGELHHAASLLLPPNKSSATNNSPLLSSLTATNQRSISKIDALNGIAIVTKDTTSTGRSIVVGHGRSSMGVDNTAVAALMSGRQLADVSVVTETVKVIPASSPRATNSILGTSFPKPLISPKGTSTGNAGTNSSGHAAHGTNSNSNTAGDAMITEGLSLQVVVTSSSPTTVAPVSALAASLTRRRAEKAIPRPESEAGSLVKSMMQALALFKDDQLDLKKDMEPFENRLLQLQQSSDRVAMLIDDHHHDAVAPPGARSIPSSIPSWTASLASSMSPVSSHVPAASVTRKAPPGQPAAPSAAPRKSEKDTSSAASNQSSGRNGSGNGKNGGTNPSSGRFATSSGDRNNTNNTNNSNANNNNNSNSTSNTKDNATSPHRGSGSSGERNSSSNANDSGSNSNGSGERTSLLRESPSHALARARTVAHPHATLPSLSFPSSPAVSGTTGVTTPSSASTLSRYSPYVHTTTSNTSVGSNDDGYERRRNRSNGSNNSGDGSSSRVSSTGSTGSTGSSIIGEHDYRVHSGPDSINRGSRSANSSRNLSDSARSDPGVVRHTHHVNSGGSTSSGGSRSSRSSTPDSTRGMLMEDLTDGPQSDLSEESLISLASGILMKHGAVPVGKMGSLLHKAANNHSLPALLKEKYGGLKKFLQLHEKDFVLGEDHPYNPHVSLRCLRMDDPLAAMMGQTSSRRPRRSSRRDSVSSTSSGGDSLGSSLTSPIPSLPSSRTTSASDSAAVTHAAIAAAKFEAEQQAAMRMANMAPLTMVLALDCEMVGVGSDGVASILARCSIVNYDNEVVYDKYVLPTETVTDYRTHVSGIRAAHLRDGTDFRQVQDEVAQIIKERILVAHSIVADLQALQLSHPRTSIRDTAFYEPLCPGRPRSLKTLVRQQLNIEFQDGAHDSVEDARAVLGVYKTVQHDWEDALSRSPDHSPLTLTSPMATSPSPSPSPNSAASPLSNAFSPSYHNHSMGSSGGSLGGNGSAMLLSSPSPSSVHSHLRDSLHTSPHHLAPPSHHSGHGIYTAAHHHSNSLGNGSNGGRDSGNNSMHHSHSHHHLGGYGGHGRDSGHHSGHHHSHSNGGNGSMHHSHLSVPSHVNLTTAMLGPSPSPSPQRIASPLSQSLSQ